MSDYQSLTENIRSFVASSFQVKNDEVVGWAEQYARLCREANERLRQCSDYLKRRLRVEAIHAAEAPPNLLDLVAALDFPEVAEWKELCFRLELADAPPLMLDTAASLNEAYAQEQPLDGLMAYHRLMALARAPIRNRLAVMRKIEEMDTTTAVLEEDIRTFERLRLEEIRQAVPALARAGDAEGVALLQEELNEHWRVGVPADLRRLVDGLGEKFRQSVGEAELRRQMPALAAAYGAMAFDQTSALLKQFLATANGYQMVTPPDLQEQLEPIFQWLAEYQEYRENESAFLQACQEFQHVLDTDAPAPRLDAAYREARGFGVELDPQLEWRYRKILRDRADAVRTKRRMIIGAAVATTVVLAVLLGLFIRRASRMAEAAVQFAAIRAATADVESGNLARVRATVKQLRMEHPRSETDPAVIRAVDEFERACAAEQERQTQFKVSMDAAKTAAVDKPDYAALSAAEAAAKLPDELKAVADLKEKIAGRSRSNPAQLEVQFRGDVKALGEEIEKTLTPELLAAHPDNYINQIAQFNERIAALDKRTEIAATDRQVRVQQLRTMLAAKEAKVEGVKVETALLDEIKRAATVEEQSAALKAYVGKVADGRYSVEFQKATALVPAEQSIEAWGKLTRDWGGQVSPATYAAAQDRVNELKKYLETGSGAANNPLAKPIGDYDAWLKTGLQAAAPQGPWKKAYRDILQNPLVHDLAVLDTNRGSRYYVLGDPKLKRITAPGGRLEFEAVLTSDVSRKDVVHPAGELTTPAPVPSPQALYAKAMSTQIDALDFTGWETIGISAVRDLLASKDINVVLKANLLSRALDANQPLMDWAGDTACKGAHDALAALNLDDVEWLDPTRPPQADLVAKLNQLLGQLPRMELIDAALRHRRDAVLAALPLGLTAGGTVMKEDAALKLYMRGNSPEGATAYAVANSGALVPVARRDARGWVLNAGPAPDVPSGSLVFVAGSGK